MAEIFNEPFTGTPGSAWNAARWPAIKGTSTTIQANGGQQNQLGGSFGLAHANSVLSGQGYMDIRFGWRAASTAESYIQVHARNDLEIDGYFLEIWPSFNEVQLNVVEDYGVIDTLGDVTSAGVQHTGLMHGRFLLDETDLKAKWWADGGAEPGTWQIEGVDSTYSVGSMALALFNDEAGNSRTVTWRYITVDDGESDPPSSPLVVVGGELSVVGGSLRIMTASGPVAV